MKIMLCLIAILFISGCAMPTTIDPAGVRTFESPYIRCYELIDMRGYPHFICIDRSNERKE